MLHTTGDALALLGEAGLPLGHIGGGVEAAQRSRRPRPLGAGGALPSGAGRPRGHRGAVPRGGAGGGGGQVPRPGLQQSRIAKDSVAK